MIDYRVLPGLLLSVAALAEREGNSELSESIQLAAATAMQGFPSAIDSSILGNIEKVSNFCNQSVVNFPIFLMPPSNLT